MPRIITANIYSQSFFPHDCSLWNNLPVDVCGWGASSSSSRLRTRNDLHHLKYSKTNRRPGFALDPNREALQTPIWWGGAGYPQKTSPLLRSLPNANPSPIIPHTPDTLGRHWRREVYFIQRIYKTCFIEMKPDLKLLGLLASTTVTNYTPVKKG